MDSLLKKIIEAAGISGYEGEIARIMHDELKKITPDARIDKFGNVIARKGGSGKKIMIAAHMDEIGLLVKHISAEGYLSFIKVGGVDDRILPAQRVIIKGRKGDVTGILGAKPPHLLKEEDRNKPLKYEDMFIDIGAGNREQAQERVALGDAVIFEPNSGVLSGRLCYGKAIDNRVGCYALLKIMERVSCDAQVYGVATAQEEVGLKGARTSSCAIDPDFAIALDTNVAGDTPQVQEKESALKLGAGVSITLIEASGRGLIVNEKMKNIFIETAKKNNIKYQVAVIEGGMTDGAMMHLNREGVATGVLAIPTRYIHSANGVFSLDDLQAAIDLGVKVIEELAQNG